MLLLVSRLAQEKSVPLAFEALKLVLRDRPDARLLLIGTGHLDDAFQHQVKDEASAMRSSSPARCRMRTAGLLRRR